MTSSQDVIIIQPKKDSCAPLSIRRAKCMITAEPRPSFLRAQVADAAPTELTRMGIRMFRRRDLTTTRALSSIWSYRWLLSWLLVSGFHAHASPAPEPLSAALDPLAAEREIYLEARQAQASGDLARYQELLPALADYPLLPYLEYNSLRPQLARAEVADVGRFLQANEGSWLGARLEREWLGVLAQQDRWAEFLQFHRTDNSTVTLSCQALQARLDAGDESALDEVAALWNVGRSQPNICDPVFAQWVEADRLTPEIAWQRFTRSLQARQTRLARYIAVLMPPREQALAELYLRVDAQPERLRDDPGLQAQGPEVEEILLQGLRRLAAIDAPLALRQTERYHASHTFDDNDLLAVQRFILLRKMLQGFAAEAEAQLQANPQLASESLISWLLRDAMRNQDWARMAFWLPRLPDEALATERWQYWQARVLTRQDDPDSIAAANAIYRDLARTRSFYGFLSADLLNRPYELVDRPVAATQDDALALYEMPAIVRARELFLAGQEVDARREWQHAVSGLTEQQVMASGRLAELWGWHRNTIQAMIRVSYWDDLQLRFPLAYTELFADAALQYDLPKPLLMSVARQESAFMHDVRSGAGALGLMQIMPATGQELARGAGMRISNQDLLQPEVNIPLGSRYIAQLLRDFDNNRAIAAAAYNAGPNRVRQWLRRTADSPLPLDMWIETIPFAETRGYVQNVLAYQVIYSHRLGEPARFLSEAEATSYH